LHQDKEGGLKLTVISPVEVGLDISSRPTGEIMEQGDAVEADVNEQVDIGSRGTKIERR